MKTHFFLCTICGNVIVKLVDSGVTPVCCGSSMVELEPNTTEASFDHHIPVIKSAPDGALVVEIGEFPHPATTQHHIMFIWLETEEGGEIRWLDDPTAPAMAVFPAPAAPVTAVYAYCNIHGLWKLTV